MDTMIRMVLGFIIMIIGIAYTPSNVNGIEVLGSFLILWGIASAFVRQENKS